LLSRTTLTKGKKALDIQKMRTMGRIVVGERIGGLVAGSKKTSGEGWGGLTSSLTEYEGNKRSSVQKQKKKSTRTHEALPEAEGKPGQAKKSSRISRKSRVPAKRARGKNGGGAPESPKKLPPGEKKKKRRAGGGM